MNKISLFRYLIKSAEREGTNKFNKMLEPLNITANQSEVLIILAETEPLSLKELGDLLICERKSPSRLIQKLVDKELIYKSLSLEDNRKAVLHLTKEGRELIPQINQIEERFNYSISQVLYDNESIDTLISTFLEYIKGTESEVKIEKRQNMK